MTKEISVKAVIIIVSTVFLILPCFLLAGCGGAPKRQQPESWRGIVPGQSKSADVVSILGEPVNRETLEAYEIYSYQSQDEMSSHQVALKDDIVQMIGVITSPEENYTLETALSQYGEPEKVTYSYLMQGAMTYIFANHGVTIVALEEGGAVLQKHYYIPMSLDAYMASWGKKLPLEYPYIR